MKILILNGPNLNLLGTREPEIYGNLTFDKYFLSLIERFPQLELSYFQSNIEGELINELQKSEAQGVIFNAAGYSHSSVSLRDCIASISNTVIEVHISNLAQREDFRHNSLITAVCSGSIMGFGLESYALACQYFLNNTPRKLGY